MSEDRYCVIGNPVEHSRSPWIHARFAEQTGQPVAYGRRLAPLDGFAATVRQFRQEGGLGCNVTVPFKFEAAALADALSARARQAGACNTLRFDGGQVFGDNTDGAGLVGDIRAAGVELAGRDLLLVGAGGAAAGVLGPLLDARPRRVVIANRTPAKAQALVDGHATIAQGAELLACGLDDIAGAFDIVVNATASSLAGGSVPVPGRVLRPGALAYDMMYGPAAEGFLAWARAHGGIARDGLGMLVEQAAASFFVWRGVRPDTAPVLAGLRALLSAGG
ncbi:shikimate dehydrogenase [Ramlibacter sp.]|uniref:shikimate dehydrogenase n=1 Tax=Ramlibacter sp. TaxID=1917967 RepID=UPI002D57EF67|nr:shikimate dehydrogenase [Ramlibacter sp.]HYD74912.1 shikimate dehydrogenase [Ramlibacter sp.]